jgi:hypothetical protein
MDFQTCNTLFAHTENMKSERCFSKRNPGNPSSLNRSDTAIFALPESTRRVDIPKRPRERAKPAKAEWSNRGMENESQFIQTGFLVVDVCFLLRSSALFRDHNSEGLELSMN